jgi:hypothetical protein
MTDGIVGDWQIGCHYRVERRPVTVRRPNLESVLGTIAEWLSVCDQRLDAECIRSGMSLKEFRVESIEK